MFEGLIENVLLAVGGEHAVVDGQTIERGETAFGDALARRFLLEIAEEGFEATRVVALHCERRRCGDKHGAGQRAGENGINFRHRLPPDDGPDGVQNYRTASPPPVPSRGKLNWRVTLS